MQLYDLQDQPLVTVIICVYNAGEYLKDSVMSIINQTYEKLEILIIDDGSTDGCISSIKHIKDNRIRIIKQSHSGKVAALNRALNEMCGDFYAIQDADDLSYPCRIERQLKYMLRNPNLAAVFCGTDLILKGKHVAPIFLPLGVSKCRQYINSMRLPAHDPTGFYRMSMVRQLKYTRTLMEGFDYVMQVGEQYPITVLGDCLYSYRVYPSSSTKQNPEYRNRMRLEAHRHIMKRRDIVKEQNIKKEISTKGRISNKDKDNDIVTHFMQSMVGLRSRHKGYQAIKTALTCLWLHPLDLYYYKPLAYAFLPFWLIKFHRHRKGL